MAASTRRRHAPLSISPQERALLLRWARGRTLAARVVVRSRIILMLADGAGIMRTAETLHVAPGTVRLWRQRFREGGPQSLLHDAPGRGRKPLLDAVTRRALRQEPWSDLTLERRARELGVSISTVSRWRRRES